MVLRLLFVLLGLANIALAAWLWLGQPYATDALPSVDPGVPALRLLSELPESATTDLPSTEAPTPANATSRIGSAISDEVRCMALGPFATPLELRSARQALAGKAARTRTRQEQLTETGSWWGYLPKSATPARALARARQLADRHISDYFVVSNGEQADSVSLGLFKDPANASRRRDQVVAAGFPARMMQRTESVPEYWLDLVLPAGVRIDWSELPLDGLQTHDASCF